MEACVGSTQDLAWHLVGPQMKAVISWENQLITGLMDASSVGPLALQAGSQALSTLVEI